MIQQTYDILTGQKRLVNDSWQVVDSSGNIIADSVVWRANLGALLTWPRQEQAPKSGYWREFFYKLQEESLEKDLAKEQAEQKKRTQPQAKQAPKKSKKTPVRVKAVEYTHDAKPKPKPVNIELAKAHVVDTALDARPLIDSILGAVFSDLRVFEKISTESKFANIEDDDEEEALILLLEA